MCFMFVCVPVSVCACVCAVLVQFKTSVLSLVTYAVYYYFSMLSVHTLSSLLSDALGILQVSLERQKAEMSQA